jgi:hypothetical protein
MAWTWKLYWIPWSPQRGCCCSKVAVSRDSQRVNFSDTLCHFRHSHFDFLGVFFFFFFKCTTCGWCSALFMMMSIPFFFELAVFNHFFWHFVFALFLLMLRSFLFTQLIKTKCNRFFYNVCSLVIQASFSYIVPSCTQFRWFRVHGAQFVTL